MFSLHRIKKQDLEAGNNFKPHCNHSIKYINKLSPETHYTKMKKSKLNSIPAHLPFTS